MERAEGSEVHKSGRMPSLVGHAIQTWKDVEESLLCVCVRARARVRA